MIQLVMFLFTLDSAAPPVETTLATFEGSYEHEARWKCEELLDFMKTQQPGGNKWAVYACVPEDEDT